MAEIKMSDLGFGSLNNIQDGNSGESGDRRRTSTTTAMRMATEAAFSKNTLNNINEFNGIVVSHRLVSFATYQNKTALFSDYLYKANQDEVEKEKKGIDYSNYAYKVYIPELEPRPAPNSNTDPVLVTYPDIYSDLTDATPIPLGTIVAVKFEDVENLFNPRIVRVVGGPIQIQNISSQELNETFNSKTKADLAKYASDPPGGEGRFTGASISGPQTGKDTSCVSFTKNGTYVKGSETQTGLKLGDGSDWTNIPDNPVSGWCLPMKPGDPGDIPTAVGGFTVGISSTFFRNNGDYHGALDFSGKPGRPIYAVDKGVVVKNLPICRGGTPSTLGNSIIIKTDSGYFVQYVHLDTAAIPNTNDKVTKGQLIGYNGDTGASQAPHLHFAVNTKNDFGNKTRTKLDPADFYPDEWIYWSNTKITVQYRDRQDPDRLVYWKDDDRAKERHVPNKSVGA